MRLILVCGLPGTGKSYFAKKLSEKIENLKILKTDEIRKELACIKRTEHKFESFEVGLYSSEMTKRTYNEMLKRAEDIIKSSEPVILDGTFSKEIYRDKAFEISRKNNYSFMIIECVCPSEIVRKRMNEREKDEKSVSDASFETYKKMKKKFEPFKNKHLISIDTSKNIDEAINSVLK